MKLSIELPTLAEVTQTRRAKAKYETPTRLQEKTDHRRDDKKEEARWRKEVWSRDRGACRWCRRPVERRIDLHPTRGECHHVSGRVICAIRWDRRNGLLLCKACHERITGKVAEKHVIESKHTFTVDGVQYINADKPVKFKRVA